MSGRELMQNSKLWAMDKKTPRQEKGGDVNRKLHRLS